MTASFGLTAAALPRGGVPVATWNERSPMIRRVLAVGEDIVVGLLAVLALPLVVLLIGVPIAAVVQVLLWVGRMI